VYLNCSVVMSVGLRFCIIGQGQKGLVTRVLGDHLIHESNE
jgi:hypothetical protein